MGRIQKHVTGTKAQYEEIEAARERGDWGAVAEAGKKLPGLAQGWLPFTPKGQREATRGKG